MNVEVLLFGQLRELTSSHQAVMSVKEGAQLTDLVERLVEKYGNAFRQEMTRIKELRILINGREYSQLGGMETHLKEGDTVVFLPPIDGG